jgi:hypothetical protein
MRQDERCGWAEGKLTATSEEAAPAGSAHAEKRLVTFRNRVWVEERDPGIRVFEARIASAPLPSWHEIDLAHRFYDTPQGTRFMISPQARTDALF